jgi:hypothetical protein
MADHCYAKCCYAYAECPILFTIMLSVILLNVVMLNVVMLSVMALFKTILLFASKAGAYPLLLPI